MVCGSQPTTPTRPLGEVVVVPRDQMDIPLDVIMVEAEVAITPASPLTPPNPPDSSDIRPQMEPPQQMSLSQQCCTVLEVSQLDLLAGVQQSTLPDGSLASPRQILSCPLFSDMSNKAGYCLKEQIPVTGHLQHFLSYWESITMDQ